MKLTQTQLIIFVSLFFVIFDNFLFFREASHYFNIPFLFGLGALLFIALSTIFALISNRFIIKPVLITLLLISSVVAYYSLEYKTIISDKMIQNILETDTKEVHDLLNIKMFLYFIFLGVLPSIFVYKVEIIRQPLKKEIFSRLKLLGFNILSVPVLYFIFGKSWASFFREHKVLRMYTNPTYYLYSFGKFINERYLTKPMKFRHIGLDAKLDVKKPRLVIFVLGEAARWDHFSLNGYNRDTNPKLKSDNVISLEKFFSCGTETAVSVPCMFSIYDRKNYSNKKAKHTDSVIDILDRAGVAVLWRDNNSNSKGVATRIKGYEDFTHAHIKPYCNDFECHDEVLLYKLDDWIAKQKSKSIFIVLHQKGSHGPEYYKRYPKEFKKFKEVCKTNELQKCSKEQIANGYDNTILYTDTFLDETIKFLKKYKDKYQIALVYAADHGESLGENGIYLHGLPYFIAPEAQKHPAVMLWFGNKFGDINESCVKSLRKRELSQDYLFSTILDLAGVKTKVYNPEKDMFEKCKEK